MASTTNVWYTSVHSMNEVGFYEKKVAEEEGVEANDIPLWCLFCLLILDLIVLSKHMFIRSSYGQNLNRKPSCLSGESCCFSLRLSTPFWSAARRVLQDKGVECWHRSLKKLVFFFTCLCLKAPASHKMCSIEASSFICVKTRLFYCSFLLSK